MTVIVSAAVVAFVVLLAGITYQRIGSARSKERFSPPGRLIDAGGRRLHIRAVGTGTPAVVFEAGIAASSVSWSLVQPAVGAFTQTCSYDRAGLAWSDPAREERCMDTFVSDLQLVIARANIRPPCILVAHSFGAFIIRAFARKHRAAVAGLVFVDPLHPDEWLQVSPEQRRRLSGGILLSRTGELLARIGFVRAALSLLGRGRSAAPSRISRLFGSEAATFLRRIVGEVQKLPADVLPVVQSHWSDPKAFRAMTEHLVALTSCAQEMSSGFDAFGDIPVVVLSAGNREPRLLAADAALAGSSAAGRHLVATRGGHWLQLDEPSLVIDAVRGVVMLSRAGA